MPLPLGLLYQGIKDIEATRYAQLASSSIIIFDHLVTFDLEVELIWNSPWSLGKTLFLINRYYTLFSVIFNNYALFATNLTDSLCVSRFLYLAADGVSFRLCHHFFQWQGWTGLIACMVAEMLLQMRLYALYSLNKKVLGLMVTCFIITSSASAAIMGKVLASIISRSRPFALFPSKSLQHFTFCVPFNVSDKFYVFWIPILAFECLLCTLALIRGFQTFRVDGTLFRSGRRLVGILIRDSVLYFIVILSTYLTCLLIWVTARPSLLEIPIGFSVAMSCVLANRITLNVREVNRGIDKDSTIPRQVTIEEDGIRTTLSGADIAQLRSLRYQPERKFVL